MVSSGNLGLIIIAVGLIVGVLAVFFYLRQRLGRRREDILSQLANKPELVRDRAYNRLAMARREVDVVARTGADVGRARELIAQSQAAFDQREFPRSYELAQSAHESLVSSRQRTSPLPATTGFRAPPPASSRAVATPAGPPPAPAVPAPSSAAATPAPPPLARNRAESHFQMGLLEQDLVVAQRDHPGAGATLEAVSLQTQAQAAFDRADYTDAFRLSLRARRTLGGHVESLAAPPGARASAPPAGELDAVGAAEKTAAADRCPNCGYPVTSGDAFCRGCGTPRTPTTCPQCGAARAPSDTFCGRCGHRYTS